MIASPSRPETPTNLEQLQSLANSVTRSYQPLTLGSIIKAAAIEARTLLKADRAAVYAFGPDKDWKGAFVSEDVTVDWTSVLSEGMDDPQFSEQFVEQYYREQPQAIANIREAGLSEPYVEILERFQVKASLTVPVFKADQLWGLLCIHQCGESRSWQQSDIELAERIAHYFSVALEQTDVSARLQYQADQQAALTGVIARIRESLDLETIFQKTVKEVRQLLQVDRAGIFQFFPEDDWDGGFVAEDHAEGLSSAVAERVKDHCFGENYTTLYQQGRMYVSNNIYEEGLKSCHVQILERFQVKANVVVPLLKGGELWGLLCIHQCFSTRQWQDTEIEFIRQIGQQLTVALTQKQQVEQIQYQANQQAALTGVIARIRESLDLETIFQTTVKEIRQLLQVDRAGIMQFFPEDDWEGNFVAEDHAEGLSSAITERVQDHCFGENYTTLYQQGRMYVSNNIYAEGLESCHVQILERFQVKANVVVPLLKGDELWGLLCIHQCFSTRQWQDTEIEFIRQIGQQLTVALTQKQQVEQIKLQATQLANADSREHALEQQKLLSATVDKIRQSLDIKEIFNTTTSETRQLLATDRVAIYQFNPDWSGSFVAESFADDWDPLVGVETRIADTHLIENQGGRYARRETFSVPDIYKAGHSDCHIELLESFQARAYAVVPIMSGEGLWGLLAAFQNTAPRTWNENEIELLAQIGSQLGVALQQAESMSQVKRQAAALQKATDRQKALARTIERIRQSLDIDEIFTTTTQEVRQLLGVDRVAIYRFNSDWSGAFVADSIVDGWQPTLPSQTVIEEVVSSSASDGNYPRNEIFVPISQGDRLWGLLMAYQISNPRHWDDDETSLLTQVGAQLGIALQQGELLKQTQQQTQQLNQTLQKLQTTQAKLIQGEKMAGLGQLVAGIAHEINNPVSFIFGNVLPAEEYLDDLIELLKLYQQQYPDPGMKIQEKIEDIDLDFLKEDMIRLMRSMKMGASRIKEIVQSMRTFSRMDESALKPVDIHQGIDSTLLILSHRLKAAGQRPKIEIEKLYGELPPVNCYAGQLNQVFMNLLGNAIDALEDAATPAGNPKIQVTTDWLQDTNTVRVTIDDNGPGIPEDALSNIFNPFFTTKPVGKGTGLGLSISYEIITGIHKGKLDCYSEPGSGTTFQIEIPVNPNGLVA